MNLKQIITIDHPLSSSRCQISERIILNKIHKEKNQSSRSRNNQSLQGQSSMDTTYNTNFLYKTIQVDKNKLSFYKNHSSLKSQKESNSISRSKISFAKIDFTDTRKQLKQFNSTLRLVNSSILNKRKGSIFSEQTINPIIEEIKKKQSSNNLVLINKKKLIKGKLQKLLNNSLIFKSKPDQQCDYKNSSGREQCLDKDTLKKEITNRILNKKGEKLNFYTFKNFKIIQQLSSNINKNKLPNKSKGSSSNGCQSRFHDFFTTPQELIFKNFSDEEIEVIKSDLKFFRLNNNMLGDAFTFKNKTLADTLNEEESGSRLSELRSKILRKCKSSYQILQKATEIKKSKINIEEKDTLFILNKFKNLKENTKIMSKN